MKRKKHIIIVEHCPKCGNQEFYVLRWSWHKDAWETIVCLNCNRRKEAYNAETSYREVQRLPSLWL